MKKLIVIIAALFVSSYTIAQSNVVNIKFEVEGKPVKYKTATVSFLYNKDTLCSKIKDKMWSIPEIIFKKRTTVIFNIDNYSLQFDSIPLSINGLSPNWTIGVDRKPFDKEKLWMIKSWKNVDIVYYLKNDNGRVFTVDYYKESKVITK